ncbi:NADH:flavin oxidoreductase/NADH oxidase [Paraburkholderia caballeronis]|uniref:NADH:flavin oxidoreductase/NADH oxidase n=1 Tax=Paraburkholderia caballeronis TaxID=416943 RepID=UPI001066EDCB|nr:NADH:flavin oxidoreductase/NADH oxidase [Paraburkholderia caballeronis]
MAEPALFTPLRLRGMTVRNRIVVSPMCQYRADEGRAGDWHVEHHARFALGGVGCAVLEATAVERDGRISEGCLGLWDDAQIDGIRRIVGVYRRQRAAVGIQLSHAGRKGSSAPPWDGAGPLATVAPARAWPTVAPSALAHASGWPAPAELPVDAIGRIVASFAAAARRAVEAGVDFIEIHGAHGYLIHSFCSPLANQRTDAYGGSPDNRMRFALDVAHAVRAAIPGDMALWYRASCVDEIDGGITLDDTVALARQLKTAGVDLIDCSAGGIQGPVARSARRETPGHQVPYAAQVRRGAGIATMAVGLITEPHHAQRIVADGDADLVALGRELLADPNFVYRAARELGLPEPHAVLPAPYAFFLARRNMHARDVGGKR